MMVRRRESDICNTKRGMTLIGISPLEAKNEIFEG